MSDKTNTLASQSLSEIEKFDAYMRRNYPNAKGDGVFQRAIAALEEMDTALGRQSARRYPAPSQPAQVGEWDDQLHRHLNALTDMVYARGVQLGGPEGSFAKQQELRFALLDFIRTRPAEDAALLKAMKFHHQASHVSPDYRDGFNAAIDAAIARLGAIGADGGEKNV